MTDTQPPTLPAGSHGDVGAPAESSRDLAERAGLQLPPAGHRRWAVPLTVAAGLVLASVTIGSVAPSKLVAEKRNERLGIDQSTPYARTPASAEPVDDLLEFGDLGDAVDQYPPKGDILFVTVTEPEQSVLSWLIGHDDPAIQFMTDEEKFGVQTPEQRRVFALESMRTAEQVAQYVALKRVGYDAKLLPGDVLIEAMVCLEPNADNTDCLTWSPSDDVLEPGDRIIEIEGEQIEGVEDLTRILKGRKPGDLVTMKIDRPEGGEAEVQVELTESPDEPGRTIVGFYPFDTRRVELPFELDINTGQIGGPSAGLAFTLTLIDELTKGELTGGGRVAVTGTIALDGTVGAIGGLRQKASAVVQAGVDVLIVPAEQGEDDIAAAQKSGGKDLTIIPVSTVEEAIQALAALGGDPIPPAPES